MSQCAKYALVKSLQDLGHAVLSWNVPPSKKSPRLGDRTSDPCSSAGGRRNAGAGGWCGICVVDLAHSQAAVQRRPVRYRV